MTAVLFRIVEALPALLGAGLGVILFQTSGFTQSLIGLAFTAAVLLGVLVSDCGQTIAADKPRLGTILNEAWLVVSTVPMVLTTVVVLLCAEALSDQVKDETAVKISLAAIVAFLGYVTKDWPAMSPWPALHKAWKDFPGRPRPRAGGATSKVEWMAFQAISGEDVLRNHKSFSGTALKERWVRALCLLDWLQASSQPPPRQTPKQPPRPRSDDAESASPHFTRREKFPKAEKSLTIGVKAPTQLSILLILAFVTVASWKGGITSMSLGDLGDYVAGVGSLGALIWLAAAFVQQNRVLQLQIEAQGRQLHEFQSQVEHSAQLVRNIERLTALSENRLALTQQRAASDPLLNRPRFSELAGTAPGEEADETIYTIANAGASARNYKVLIEESRGLREHNRTQIIDGGRVPQGGEIELRVVFDEAYPRTQPQIRIESVSIDGHKYADRWRIHRNGKEPEYMGTSEIS